jgi:hypothetical protein
MAHEIRAADQYLDVWWDHQWGVWMVTPRYIDDEMQVDDSWTFQNKTDARDYALDMLNDKSDPVTMVKIHKRTSDEVQFIYTGSSRNKRRAA